MTEVVRMALQTEVVARLDDSEGASPYRGYIGGMYCAVQGPAWDFLGAVHEVVAEALLAAEPVV